MLEQMRTRRASIMRLMYICQKLRSYPCSLDEILDHLQAMALQDDMDYTIDKRTFQRDIKEIYYVFGMEIKYDRRLKRYRINDLDKDKLRFVESIDTIHALRVKDRLNNSLFFEDRKPLGTEHMHGFLHAISRHQVVHFDYRKYEDESAKKREVEPYAIKEFKHRWYLVGKSREKNDIRIFGLDRIVGEIRIMPERFEPGDFDVQSYFEHCFGIIRPDWMQPCEIILAFKPLKAAYVENLAWHPSQKVIKRDDHEVHMRFFLYPTYDLVQEILSHGDEIRVIAPKSLKEEVLNKMKNAMDQTE